jgi:hypothetical protein
MAFDPTTIIDGVQPKSRKMVLYGTPKLGKSTLASMAKNSFLIPTEDRVAHIDCKKSPICHTYAEVFDVMVWLLENKANHNFRRIIIDSLDWLEPMLHQYVLEKLQANGSKAKTLTDDNSKDTAFFKGLQFHAVNGWKSFLKNCDLLCAAGFDVILVAHDRIIKVDPPTGEKSYDMHVMKIDKYSLPVIEEWADIIAFYDQRVYVIPENEKSKKGKATAASDKRSLYLSGESPAMMSGNSFGLPDVDVSLEECQEVMEWVLTANMNPEKKKEIEVSKKKKGE